MGSYQRVIQDQSSIGRRWQKADFSDSPVNCASKLVGTTLLWNGCGGIVVEVEAYSVRGDEACLAFANNRGRSFISENSAGTVYAYLNYGIHWLLNVLTKHESSDGFVLIRAIEPQIGVPIMKKRRNKRDVLELCSGPAKLTQALGIGKSSHGLSIVDSSERGFFGESNGNIVSRQRIGISKAADLNWRFVLKNSRYVSR